MFLDLTFDYKTLTEFPAFYAPITSQEGAIILNTEMLSENNLDRPESLKDLTKPEYKDLLSVTDIKSSSTAWLLMQALVSEYGENGAKDVLKGIYENAGAHIESSATRQLLTKKTAFPWTTWTPKRATSPSQSPLQSLTKKRRTLWPWKWLSALWKKEEAS